MIFKYVCISIGFTYKSWSKIKLADNTLKNHPVQVIIGGLFLPLLVTSQFSAWVLFESQI